MSELHWGHKGGVDFPNYGGLVPPARVAPDNWLSSLPEDWQIVLVKHIFAFNEKGRGSDSEAILSLTQRGVLERDISGNEGQLAESYENYPQVLEGDFVLNPMDLVAGWVARTNIRGKVSGAYYSFHIIDHGRADGRFFEYLFQTYYRERIFDPFGSGLGRMESGGGRWTLGRDVLMNFPVPLPPINIQRVLAAYLDQETSQIDLLISKKEQLIEKLLERRQALITQAVTKGLDPNVPMKDSGVEWIGNSPIEWSVRRLSTLANLQTGATPEGAYFSDAEGFPWLRPDDLDKVRGVVQATRFIPADTAKGMVTAPAGSSLMSGIGNVGDVAFLRAEASHNQQLTSVKARGENDRYLYFSLVAAKQEIQRLAVGNVVQILNNARLGSLQVPVPPLAIQKAIAEFLDSNCERIDTLIERSRAAVGCLQERRQALITQVVTGKLDVRGFDGGNS